MFLEIELKFVAVGQTFPNVLFLSIILFVSVVVVQSRELMSGLKKHNISLSEEKVSHWKVFTPTCWYPSLSSPRCPLELLFSLRLWK